jgi:RNA polymerase sigma-70 factor (ECF subfamily)
VEDAALLHRIRAGDEEAFDVLFRRYYQPLVAFTTALLKVRDIAEDVVQDVMLELWRRREALDMRESCRAYLFRAARNRALNELRHEEIVRRAEPMALHEIAPAPAPAADEPVSTDELEVAIARAVTGLPVPLRECFEMSRRDGLKYSEIAQALDISIKTVEARMGRALRELRERLSAWLPEAPASHPPDREGGRD